MLFQKGKPLASPLATKAELQTGNRVSTSELRSRVLISLKPYISPVAGYVRRSHEGDVKLRAMFAIRVYGHDPERGSERWKQFSRDRFVSSRVTLDPHAFQRVYI